MTDYPELEGVQDCDVVIVGADIVGLTAALCLLDAGKSVVVLEARRVGRQVTGRSSAKVTTQHSLIYRYLADIAGEEIAQAYADANRNAVATIKEWVKKFDIDCDYEPKHATFRPTVPVVPVANIVTFSCWLHGTIRRGAKRLVNSFAPRPFFRLTDCRHRQSLEALLLMAACRFREVRTTS
ncbi:FAD-binding oxidoreductase [Microvirga sp. KLBC 81]|uniref:NAD(P)/FAD-dependent oxidoreductase n=1 Tax=Microvirga sp. KLBC 81 TaxID=1862707 RepID=UPI00197BF964|nr:FAD-binding oxidoreductase [Microvirga sp. KLBC 81]